MGLPSWLRHALRTVCHIVLDAAAVYGAYRLAHLIRFDWAWFAARVPPSGGNEPWETYLSLLNIGIPVWLMILYSNRLYTAAWMSAADRFLQIMKSAMLGTGVILVFAFLYARLSYSRLLLAGVFPVATLLLCASHVLTAWLDDILAGFEAARPVLLIGGGPVADLLKERIISRHPGADIRQLPALPTLEEFIRHIENPPVHEVIHLHNKDSRDLVLSAAEACDTRAISFKMIPDLLEIRMGEVQMDHHLGLPAYRIKHSSLTRANFLTKRAFDIAVSVAVLTLTAPLWLLICLLIKLDSRGPILFTQKRYGYQGQVFRAFKFRTMVVDAEKSIADVKAASADGGAFFKAKNDPRVTRVGKWLRRFSLDEFPQFINTLMGDMSVVGPRPLALTTGEVDALEREFGATAKKRTHILPGITGLWQISGRSDVSSEQRFALDLFYIEHWSMGLDLEIILKTPAVMIFGKGAY